MKSVSKSVKIKSIIYKKHGFGGAELRDHSGHRERLRKKFIINDVDSLEDHEILELALFYAIPRKNTNEIAHNLLDTFGSITAIFDAPINQLKKVNGMGESSAVFIKLICSLTRLYHERKYSDKNSIMSFDELKDLLANKFIGRNEEVVAVSLLDAKGKLLFSGVINKGSVNGVDLYVRKIIELVTFYNASSFIMAHNHPSGIAIPSRDDINSTEKIFKLFESMGVRLIDHIIVTDGDYVSLYDTLPGIFGARGGR